MKRVQEAFRHHDSVMVQMPTGTGKTMVLANIVFSFLEKCNHPIWIVAHRRELVSQIKDTLNKSLLIFSKTHPQWSLHPLRFPRSRGTETFLTVKEGSTSHLGLFPSGKKRKTALQCYICPTCPSPAGWSLILNQAFPLTIKRKGCNRPPVLRTASL